MRRSIFLLLFICSVAYGQLRMDGAVVHFTQVNDHPKFRSNMFAHLNAYYSFKFGLNLGYGLGYNNFFLDEYYPAFHHGPSVLYNVNIKNKYSLGTWAQVNWIHFVNQHQPVIDSKAPSILVGIGYPITFINNSVFQLIPTASYLYFNQNHYMGVGVIFSFHKRF